MTTAPYFSRHYIIAHRVSGEPVELERSQMEVVFLAWDTITKQLVELHILNKGQLMDASMKRSAMDRLKQAMDLRGLSFMRVLEVGEEDGVVFYATNLNDGEAAEAYVNRRGALPAMTAFRLVQQYLEDLLAARQSERLLSLMRVGSPLVTTNEDAFLQLRIVDYGLSESEAINDEMRNRRVVAECCQLLFMLLTGQAYEGQNPDRFPTLTSLPTNLRVQLRTALVDEENASPSLEKLKDDIREAYASLVASLQVRSSRKHLILNDSIQPLSQVQALLLEHVPVADLLKGRFTVANGDDLHRYPFSIPAINEKTRDPLTVHLLPPSNIVDKAQYDAVPLQMWRFNQETHPNILRSLSLWETSEWTFLTEEREPGLTVSRLLAERITLNPAEVAVLLHQVQAGLDQARECGVDRVDIHPSNLFLKVGRDGAQREADRLMQKRLDSWPKFTLKVRTHTTMRSLYEPHLVDPMSDQPGHDRFNGDRDFRNRSFVALAVYLLTGDRQFGGVPEFGEAIPEPLAAYLKEMLSAGKQPGGTPATAEFLHQFEKHMVPIGPEGRGLAAIRAAGGVPLEEMESVGSVSDFSEDWSEDWAAETTAPDYLVDKKSRVNFGMQAMPKERRGNPGSMGVLMWAVAALVLLAVVFMTITGGGKPVPESASSPADATSGTEFSTASMAGSKDEGARGESGSGAKKQPEVIKKAIVPPPWEVEKLKKIEEESPISGGVISDGITTNVAGNLAQP
jgi:hypothetical protein